MVLVVITDVLVVVTDVLVVVTDVLVVVIEVLVVVTVVLVVVTDVLVDVTVVLVVVTVVLVVVDPQTRHNANTVSIQGCKDNLAAPLRLARPGGIALNRAERGVHQAESGVLVIVRRRPTCPCLWRGPSPGVDPQGPHRGHAGLGVSPT